MKNIIINRRTLLSLSALATGAALLPGCQNLPATPAKNQNMTYRGIVYDVGLLFNKGLPYSVANYDPTLAAHDIRTIARELHANAIRIEGEEIDRLVSAARFAHQEGLSVFFNPWKMNVPAAELPNYFEKAAIAAETLRHEGVDITFIAGCEMSIFNEGIIDGDVLMDRVGFLVNLANVPPQDAYTLLLEKSKLVNLHLASINQSIRQHFKGHVTYAAGTWEFVDWDIFDSVGIDHYRSHETAAEYIGTLDRFRLGKPLMVMEVGSCAYEGAAKLGGSGFMVLEGANADGSGIFKGGITPTRSEREQADYVEEQLLLLNNANIDGVFIYVFSFPTFRFGEGAKDLDMVSFSLVKTYPEGHPIAAQMPPWEPKEAFHRIASIYKKWADDEK